MYLNEKKKSHQESTDIETAASGAYAFKDVYTCIFCVYIHIYI